MTDDQRLGSIDVRRRRRRAEHACRRGRLVAALGILTATALVAMACGAGTGSTEVRAEVPRASTTGGDSAAATAAIDALAADLYGRLRTQPGNLVFSPYSIEMALAMTRNGAAGETRSQMDAVLHAGAGEDLDRALNVLDQELAKRPGPKGDDQRNGDLELATANALWGQKDMAFEQKFLEVLAAQYGAGMKVVDYKTAAEAARTEINAWVSERTKGKIVDLLPAGSLDDLTRLVLVNAVYFKAPWAKKFGRLDDRPFTTAAGTTVNAPTMSTHGTGTYGKGDGWRAAEIPYLGNEMSMVVIVPDDLATFEASLDGANLGSIVRSPKEALASVTMPLFTFRTQVQLEQQLSALGMPRPFSDDAEFPAMTRTEQVRIKDVFHQAFIAVDEEGTEAAAATAVVMEAVSAPAGENLVVDRPFLFAIKDVPTGAILFLGRVTDPTTKNG